MSGRLDLPNVQSMAEVARVAMAYIPPDCRFTSGDAQAIVDHRELLLGLGTRLVTGFYDTLYAHPPTAAVFRDNERSERERTLDQWWQRTVSGPLDDDYFSWMAMVGLVHVSRGVQNPAMLAMAEHIVDVLAAEFASSDMPIADRDRLVEAFRRLVSTLGALITFGYTFGYEEAIWTVLDDVVGMPEGLLRRLRVQQMIAAVDRARAERHVLPGPDFSWVQSSD